MSYQRPQSDLLSARLAEPRRFIQVAAGPRQVGKTTLVQRVVGGAAVPVQFASADEPTLRGAEWIAQQWEAARLMAEASGAVLVLDEVQKVGGWSETVKRLWDEDTRKRRPIKVVLLGRPRCSFSAACPRVSPGASRCCICRTGRRRRCTRPSAGRWRKAFSMAAIRARRRWPRITGVGCAMCATR